MNNAGGERGLACCGHPQAAFSGLLWSVWNDFLRTAFINMAFGLWCGRTSGHSGDRRHEIKLSWLYYIGGL